MKLDVLQSTTAPWYAEGLKFTCAQCGNCCTGGPGYVWITKEEILQLAKLLKLSPKETTLKYCRKVGSRISLKEVRSASGQYDCIFLTEQKTSGNGDQVAHTKRVCGVYEARPLQCRTWPFWEGNLRSEEAWNRAGVHCHGINRGRKFSLNEIAKLKDAKTWPKRPPTSAQSEFQSKIQNQKSKM